MLTQEDIEEFRGMTTVFNGFCAFPQHHFNDMAMTKDTEENSWDETAELRSKLIDLLSHTELAGRPAAIEGTADLIMQHFIITPRPEMTAAADSRNNCSTCQPHAPTDDPAVA